MACRVGNSARFVLALFMQTCLVLGTVKSLGVFLGDLDVSLEMTDTDNGIMFGIYMAATYCPGPLVAYLFHKRLFRRLQIMLGSILGPGGLICASFSPNKYFLIASLALSGVGNCVMSFSFIISMNEVATDRFNVYFGFGKSGYAFGMSVIPLIADFLTNLYGWRGATMLIGAIMSHVIPLAMTLKTSPSSSLSSNDSGENEERSQLLEHDKRDEEEENLRNGDREGIRSDLTMAGCCGRPVVGIYKSRHIPQTDTEQCELSQHYQSVSSQRDVDKMASATPQKHIKYPPSKLLKSHDSYIFTQLKNSVFYKDLCLITILMADFFFAMVNCSWHSFLLPRAVDRGIPTTKAVGLVISAAVACFLGRFMVGFVNLRFLTYHDAAVAMTILNISSLLLESLLRNYVIMLMTSFLSSVAIASRSVLIVIIMKERGQTADFPLLFSFTEVVYGVGAFFGPYAEGVMGDILGSLDKCFFLLAALDGVVLLLLLPPRCVKRPSHNAEH